MRASEAQSRVAYKAARIHFKRLFSERVTTANEMKFTCELTTHELSLKSETNFNEMRIVALVYNIAELSANFCRRLISGARRSCKNNSFGPCRTNFVPLETSQTPERTKPQRML